MRRTMWALVIIQTAFAGTGIVRALQPGLTEVDTLRLQNVKLQEQLADAQAEGDVCRAVLGPLRARANQEQLKRAQEAAITAIESAHPGYAFDRQTGRLVAVPPEVPPRDRK